MLHEVRVKAEIEPAKATLGRGGTSSCCEKHLEVALDKLE